MNTKQLEQDLLNKIKYNQEQSRVSQQYQMWIVWLSVVAVVLSALAWLVMWVK